MKNEGVDSYLETLPVSIRRGAAGGTAAALGKTFTAPLERIRIIRQAAERGHQNSQYLARSIYREEGFLGLWRGNAVNLARVVPSYAVRFTVFGNLSAYQDRFPFLGNTFTAGSLAGLASSLASYPLEVLRTRISVDGTLMNAFRRGSLFAGCSLTVIETMP
jgi:solute carrier family 25 phosphate transporter 23/24/25/41